MKAWGSGTFARAILVALLLVSIVPIFIISLLFIDQSTNALTGQMESNLEDLVKAEAQRIDLKLQEVIHATEIAAGQAVFVLEQDISDEEIQAAIDRYQPDNRNLLGLDVFYSANGSEEALGLNLSNVYWNNNTPINNEVARQIVLTEALDPIFGALKGVSPDTQWIYLTTPDGMMRLYPWASNDHYPDAWDPREIIFYTVAEPEANPGLQTQWTPPYVDFAGAGWMVTVSTPVVSHDGEFMGVLSHDITIESLKNNALDIDVLDGAGYGFLIDQDGNVIAHPDYQDAEATEGTQETTNLLTSGSPAFQMLIGKMVNGQTGLGSYTDASNQEQILVYAPIPSIGWSLGIVVPHTAVVAPAIAMRSRVMVIALLLVGVAAAVALLMARRIHRPITQLLHGVNQLSAAHRPDDIRIDSFREFRELADAFNVMGAKVWERENHLKKTVSDLRIEIDFQRSQREIHALSETEYFQYLEQNAERIRRDVRGLSDEENDAPHVEGNGAASAEALVQTRLG